MTHVQLFKESTSRVCFINYYCIRLPLTQEPVQLEEPRAAVQVLAQSALPLQACIRIIQCVHVHVYYVHGTSTTLSVNDYDRLHMQYSQCGIVLDTH